VLGSGRKSQENLNPKATVAGQDLVNKASITFWARSLSCFSKVNFTVAWLVDNKKIPLERDSMGDIVLANHVTCLLRKIATKISV
jgi:hypothetical protein